MENPKINVKLDSHSLLKLWLFVNFVQISSFYKKKKKSTGMSVKTIKVILKKRPVAQFIFLWKCAKGVNK